MSRASGSPVVWEEECGNVWEGSRLHLDPIDEKNETLLCVKSGGGSPARSLARSLILV